jgi:hypothetical protein
MMYYNFLLNLRTHFDSDAIVNTVTQGSLHDVDLAKQTLFPLVHIVTNSATLEDRMRRFNITVIAMDIVDISKSKTVDVFRGNDNELDVLNTQLEVLNRFVELLRRGDLYDGELVLDGIPSAEPFTERFENLLAGWSLTLDILVPNDMTIC